MAPIASPPKPAGALPDVFRGDLRLVFLSHVAADVFARGPRIQSEIGRLAGELAARRHRNWRLPGRAGERRLVPALGPPHWPPPARTHRISVRRTRDCRRAPHCESDDVGLAPRV